MGERELRSAALQGAFAALTAARFEFKAELIDVAEDLDLIEARLVVILLADGLGMILRQADELNGDPPGQALEAVIARVRKGAPWLL